MLFLGRPTAAERRAQAMLDLLGLGPVADRKVESLSLGMGRLVEITAQISPKLVLLDEPSSGLDRARPPSWPRACVPYVASRDRSCSSSTTSTSCASSSNGFVLDFGTLIAPGTTSEVFADTVRKAYLGDMV